MNHHYVLYCRIINSTSMQTDENILNLSKKKMAKKVTSTPNPHQILDGGLLSVLESPVAPYVGNLGGWVWSNFGIKN